MSMDMVKMVKDILVHDHIHANVVSESACIQRELVLQEDP